MCDQLRRLSEQEGQSAELESVVHRGGFWRLVRDDVVLAILEPVPVDGCGVCAALVKQREQARTARTRWTVQECNDELSNHARHRQAVEGPLDGSP